MAVSANGGLAAPPGGAIPSPDFTVRAAAAVQYAAVPTLSFELAIEAAPEQPIRSMMLDVQLQIAARQRGYGADTHESLWELFGTPDQWSSTLRTLPWIRTTLVVPPFTGATVVALPVTCSYDLEVTASRYFAALPDGEVPLEFLFTGSMFFTTPAGALQTARIAWDREATYRLPVAVWKQAIARHFPDSSWLRLRRQSFERLCAYKAQHALPSFEAALDSLLAAGEARR